MDENWWTEASGNVYFFIFDSHMVFHWLFIISFYYNTCLKMQNRTCGTFNSASNSIYIRYNREIGMYATKVFNCSKSSYLGGFYFDFFPNDLLSAWALSQGISLQHIQGRVNHFIFNNLPKGLWFTMFSETVSNILKYI